MTRPIYRQWANEDGQHFMKMMPNGSMTEIVLMDPDNIGGTQTRIYQLGPLNPINEKVFIKHKAVLKKADWVKVLRTIEGKLKKLR